MIYFLCGIAIGGIVFIALVLWLAKRGTNNVMLRHFFGGR